MKTPPRTRIARATIKNALSLEELLEIHVPNTPRRARLNRGGVCGFIGDRVDECAPRNRVFRRS